MASLPNAHQAIIDDRKLAGYTLNGNHEEGRHKAFVFKTVLGITASDADELKSRILHQIKHNPAKIKKEDRYGKRYSVEFSWTRSRRTATIMTGWIIRTNENIP